MYKTGGVTHYKEKKINFGQSLAFILRPPLRVFGGLRKQADTITVLAVSWN